MNEVEKEKVNLETAKIYWTEQQRLTRKTLTASVLAEEPLSSH